MEQLTYTCRKCRLHLHQDAAGAMCEKEHGRFLCISCNHPLDAQTTD